MALQRVVNGEIHAVLDKTTLIIAAQGI